jgi:hypothetical protein
MSMTANLEQITKGEARRRYEKGLHVGVTNDRPGNCHTGYTFTQKDMGGISFGELVEKSTDTRRPSAVFWLRPSLGEAEWLLAHLSPIELVCAARTLGELYVLGVFDKYGEHLSSLQADVAAKASALASDEPR